MEKEWRTVTNFKENLNTPIIAFAATPILLRRLTWSFKG